MKAELFYLTFAKVSSWRVSELRHFLKFWKLFRQSAATAEWHMLLSNRNNDIARSILQIRNCDVRSSPVRSNVVEHHGLVSFEMLLTRVLLWWEKPRWCLRHWQNLGQGHPAVWIRRSPPTAVDQPAFPGLQSVALVPTLVLGAPGHKAIRCSVDAQRVWGLGHAWAQQCTWCLGS